MSRERLPRVIYGSHSVEEALAAHPDAIEAVYVESAARHPRLVERARAAGLKVAERDRAALTGLAGTSHHNGVVAAISPFVYEELADLLEAARERGEAPLLLLLDSVTDPQNLGACLRSAHVFGAHGVVIPKDRAAQVTPAVARASAGASEHIPVARVTNLARAIEDLKEEGVWSVAAVAAGGAGAPKPPWQLDFRGATALVIGAEGAGIRPLVTKTCDLATTIPMTGAVGSLNASAAAAVLLYEAFRQRRM